MKTTHIMSNAPTLMDQSGAFDATVDSIPGRNQTVTLQSSTVRTTVLPQVEYTGEAVTLVSASRPRFQEKRALGEGGIGEVVAAFDQDIGREVAIKRLRPGMQGPSTVARFVDEIRTVGAARAPEHRADPRRRRGRGRVALLRHALRAGRRRSSRSSRSSSRATFWRTSSGPSSGASTSSVSSSTRSPSPTSAGTCTATSSRPT